MKTYIPLLNVLFLSLICLFFVTGCGFTLRNQYELPPQLHVIYLKTPNPYDQFTSYLRQTLASSNIKVTNKASEAPIILNILSSNLTNSFYSINPSSQTRIYTITYSVSYEIANSKGKILVPAQAVSSSNTLNLPANQMLQSNNQLQIVVNDLQRDIIQQIYDRLSSASTQQQLAKMSPKIHEN